MTQVTNNNSEVLEKILNEIQSIHNDIKELKEEKKEDLWKQSVEYSLKKVWDNKADEEWHKLL